MDGKDRVSNLIAPPLVGLKGYRRAFVVWLRDVLLPARLPGMRIDAVLGLSEVRNMLAGVIEWTEEWKQQGLEEGCKEGLEKGLEEGCKTGREEGRKEGVCSRNGKIAR